MSTRRLLTRPNVRWSLRTATRAHAQESRGYKPWTELAPRLAAIVPGRLTKSFRATGGSEAVELALQAAMVHTKRRRFVSLEDAYHGNTIAALSIGASENRETFPNLLQSCDKIAPPLDARALEKIEARLKRRDIAAFVMEPVSINLGVRERTHVF